MTWKELKLSKNLAQSLRKEFGIQKPEEVVKLAWGAPELLCRVLPSTEVARLREEFASSDAGSFDSGNFKMGAWFGSPNKSSFDGMDEFELQRDDILSEIEREISPGKRSALEEKLLKLYER